MILRARYQRSWRFLMCRGTGIFILHEFFRSFRPPDYNCELIQRMRCKRLSLLHTFGVHSSIPAPSLQYSRSVGCPAHKTFPIVHACIVVRMFRPVSNALHSDRASPAYATASCWHFSIPQIHGKPSARQKKVAEMKGRVSYSPACSNTWKHSALLQSKAACSPLHTEDIICN